MKVSGKNIFTIESVNKNKPELKQEVKSALEAIETLMQQVGIDKVEL